MIRFFLAAVLALGLCFQSCIDVYADEQFTNTGGDRYESPDADSDTEETGSSRTSFRRKKKDENGKPLPIILRGDHSEYDNDNGDFRVYGNVVITQGNQKLVTDHAAGNIKTGDIFIDDGANLMQPGSKMNGKWIHYNFNNEIGEIKDMRGRGGKDWFEAPHAIISDKMLFMDEGGISTRCPAVEHKPCVLIKAKTFEVYPNDKLIANDVQVYVKGVHVYSRDKWINDLNKNQDKIMPRIGWDGHTNGFYGELTIEKYFGNKTEFRGDLFQYSRKGYKPMYELRHDENDFRIAYKTGWEEDDDVWYSKHSDWRFDWKKHRIANGLPLSYSAYAEYGLWKHEQRSYNSWHFESAFYINHDPIYLFNTKNTSLRLTVGRKWTHEGYTGELRTTNMYFSTFRQRFGTEGKWSTWLGYYQQDYTSSLFGLYEPDMAKEVRNGIEYKSDERNTFSIINRFDSAKGAEYETVYKWQHRFCCWILEVLFEKEIHKKDHDGTLKVHYYFLNW